MVSRMTAFTFWHESPPRAAMACVEGAWTDDDKYKLGGYFASELKQNMEVFLDTSGDFRVKKCTASTDVPIGRLISEPQGPHVENSRYATVLLYGATILEVECATNSAINVGAPVTFTLSSGTNDCGKWTSDSAANGTLALAAYATASGAGYFIPVLFGKISF